MAECPMPHMPVRDYCPACGWRASEKKAPEAKSAPKEGQVEGTQIAPDEAPAEEVYFPRDAPTIVGQEEPHSDSGPDTDETIIKGGPPPREKAPPAKKAPPLASPYAQIDAVKGRQATVKRGKRGK